MSDIARPCSLHVSYRTFQDARQAAFLANSDGVDAWAEMILLRELATIPALDELRLARAKAEAAVRKEWKEKHGGGAPDDIP